MNIWYTEEELKKLEEILKQLKALKKENTGKIKNYQKNLVNKYSKYFKYIQKQYWQDKTKIRNLEKINGNVDLYSNNIGFIISNLKDINYNYNNLINKDNYSKVLTEENYSVLSEYYKIIRNYLSNTLNEKMIMESIYIKDKTYKLFYKLRYSLLYTDIDEDKYDYYYNSDWYEVIKDYQSIIEIYNEAFTEIWPYDKFYHISNAYKLFAKIKWNEFQKQKKELESQNKMLQDLPVYLAIVNPNVTSTYDKKTLLMTKKGLIKKLQNANEEEQNKIIESLYQINLTRKM